MSFQAYLDNIKAKTGKTADDFKAMATEKGLKKTAEIMAWLKSDYGLGHGHAMAIVHLIVHEDHRAAGPQDKVKVFFSGKKAKWRQSYDDLMIAISAFGPGVSSSAGQTYINLLRGAKKFAIVQPSSADRLDIGIKLKGVEPTARFGAAGAWNAMVTHRVAITDPKDMDSELIEWLERAYIAV